LWTGKKRQPRVGGNDTSKWEKEKLPPDGPGKLAENKKKKEEGYPVGHQKGGGGVETRS